MTEGYFYTLLALLGFGALGVFHKLGGHVQVPAQFGECAALRMVAGVCGHCARRQAGGLGRSAGIPGLAIPFGVSASIAILAFQAGIRHGDIATSWLAINLSSGMPTMASISFITSRWAGSALSRSV